MVIRSQNNLLFKVYGCYIHREINNRKQSTQQSGSFKIDDANAQSMGEPAPVPSACSLDDPDCEACQ